MIDLTSISNKLSVALKILGRIPINLTSLSNKLSVQLFSTFLTENANLGSVTRRLKKLSCVKFSLDKKEFIWEEVVKSDT